MSARRAVWEVARREIVERSRSRVLRISLVLLLVLSVGGAIAAARLSGRTPTDDVGLVGARSAALAPAIRARAEAAGRRVHLRRLRDVRAASRAVRDGAIDVALLDGRRMLVKASRTQQAVHVVQDAVAGQAVLERLRRSGLTAPQALGILAPRPLPVTVLQARPRSYERNKAFIAIALLALFMMLVFFGQAVAQGVTEEKGSRVVELLLTTLSPRRLLAGKILGIGLLGLGLLLLPGAAALAAGRLAGGAGLPSAAPEAIALILLWFVLGYVFYSVGFAAVGALVSRQEDLNTAMLPVNAVLIGAFYVAIAVVNTNPDGTLARIAAFIPFFSPTVVPARVVLGDMNALGLTVAVAVEVLGIGAAIVLAARAYERAILRVGAPVKLHHLLAARRPGAGRAALSARVDVAMRLTAMGLVLAGVVIGFGRPAAIALLAAGLLLLIVERTLKQGPRRPVP